MDASGNGFRVAWRGRITGKLLLAAIFRAECSPNRPAASDSVLQGSGTGPIRPKDDILKLQAKKDYMNVTMFLLAANRNRGCSTRCAPLARTAAMTHDLVLPSAASKAAQVKQKQSGCEQQQRAR